MENKIEKLSELVELLKTGVITKDEFEELKKEILNQNSSPQKHCGGTLTISFDGQWLLLDATTKLFINDVLHSTHSTKEGFKVTIPIASSKVFVKTMISSSAATIYDLVGLDESKNYHLKLTYSAAWGRYSDKINLTEEGGSPDEQVTVKSNSNKHPVKVYVYAFIIMFLFLGISLVCKNMKSSEGSSTSTSESSSSSSNSTSSSSESKQIDNTNTCNICGKEFTGKGYEEVSEGVWKPCQEPYQSSICSPSCGLQSTRNIDKVLEKYGINPSTIHDNNSSHESSDGRIYENNACPLCNGTGIEKNTSHLSDEYGRICPMCDGKGVRSY